MRTGKWELIDFINGNPAMIDRTVQDHLTGLVAAAKDICDYFEVCESVLDASEVFGYFNGEIDMLFNLPDTSRFRRFLRVNVIPRKFPQSAK